MTGPDRDRPIETPAQHDEIPLIWKLTACAVLMLLVSLAAVLLALPFSCVLNDWPRPVCQILWVVTGQADKGE